MEKDPEYEVDLAIQHKLAEVVAVRETTLKLNRASTAESVSFDIVYNLLMLFLAV